MLDKGYDPADQIKFSFMDALYKGGLLPSTQFSGAERLQTLKYEGSIPYPDCQSIYHWFVLKQKMKMSKQLANGLREKFLLDKDIFGENPTNARQT